MGAEARGGGAPSQAERLRAVRGHDRQEVAEGYSAQERAGGGQGVRG